ncbi:MAG: hypothetical protein JSW64_02625 [Candidatus Zixiibacteriota bacterium]|nr:MAG: hypothetical protein JSW64_02625 [candidate division Zixibacteria bacterium]
MKIINIVLLIFLMTSFAIAQNYQIDWYVIASGGGEMSSTNYSVNGTAGQPITGSSSSPSYIVESGYWVGAGAPAGCDYTVGDVNGSDSYNGLDITYGVNYFKGGPDPMCPYGSCPIPPCDVFYYCGDVNASCSYNGLDITYGVNYFKGGPGPLPCGDCPPSGLIVTSVPGEVIKSPAVLNVKPKVKVKEKEELKR